MSDRKTIRDQVKAQLATTYSGDIFTGRKIDARDATEFLNVFLANGDSYGEGIEEKTESSLVIGIHKQAATDDELDIIGDSLEAAIGENLTLNGLISGLVYTGFEYNEDESSGFDQLYLKYTVIY